LLFAIGDRLGGGRPREVYRSRPEAIPPARRGPRPAHRTLAREKV